MTERPRLGEAEFSLPGFVCILLATLFSAGAPDAPAATQTESRHALC